MSSEFDRIARLRAKFGKGDERVVLGIGDDGAVLDLRGGSTVVSVDTSIENTHWRRTWLSWRDIGYRSQVAAMSDLAAMGADPGQAVIALACPESLDDDAFDQLADGISEAAREIGYSVVGGNLSRASEVSITTTVFGAIPFGPEARKPVTRAGARPGDDVYVTGVIGAAALGLCALERGNDEASLTPFVHRWRRPVPRFAESAMLRAHATACIDVSDGLLQDAGHLAAASQVGIVLEADALPRLEGWSDACAALGVDPQSFGLAGGENYELLFTCAPTDALGSFAKRVGTVADGPASVRLLDGAGRSVPLLAAGFDHFRATAR